MDNTKLQARVRRSVALLRQQFAQEGNGVFDTVLPVEETARLIEKEVPCGRDRLYPPLTILRLFIGQVLSED